VDDITLLVKVSMWKMWITSDRSGSESASAWNDSIASLTEVAGTASLKADWLSMVT